jgi:hypothetical protein
MSSGSRRCDIPVESTRSQNMTVRGRTSSDHPSVVVGSAGDPQKAQNRAATAMIAWQWEQARWRGSPHQEQTRAESALPSPHLWQVIIDPRRAARTAHLSKDVAPASPNVSSLVPGSREPAAPCPAAQRALQTSLAPRLPPHSNWRGRAMSSEPLPRTCSRQSATDRLLNPSGPHIRPLRW